MYFDRNIKEQILEKTNRGLHIFNYYMPFEFKPKKNFKNPFYDDQKASCNIYFDGRANCYKMHDFGNSEYSGDCFWFAALTNHLDVKRDFPEVLELIDKDLCLNIERKPFQKTQPTTPNSIVQKHTPPVMIEKSSVLPFKTIEKPFAENELQFWKDYGISYKTLSRYNVKTLSS